MQRDAVGRAVVQRSAAEWGVPCLFEVACKKPKENPEPKSKSDEVYWSLSKINLLSS